jgi:hypothetical protein
MGSSWVWGWRVGPAWGGGWRGGQRAAGLPKKQNPRPLALAAHATAACASAGVPPRSTAASARSGTAWAIAARALADGAGRSSAAWRHPP